MNGDIAYSCAARENRLDHALFFLSWNAKLSILELTADEVIEMHTVLCFSPLSLRPKPKAWGTRNSAYCTFSAALLQFIAPWTKDLGFHNSTLHWYPLSTAFAVPFGQFVCSNLRTMRTTTMVVKDRANPLLAKWPLCCAHAASSELLATAFACPPHFFRLDSILLICMGIIWFYPSSPDALACVGTLVLRVTIAKMALFYFHISSRA